MGERGEGIKRESEREFSLTDATTRPTTIFSSSILLPSLLGGFPIMTLPLTPVCIIYLKSIKHSPESDVNPSGHITDRDLGPYFTQRLIVALKI